MIDSFIAQSLMGCLNTNWTTFTQMSLGQQSLFQVAFSPFLSRTCLNWYGLSQSLTCSTDPKKPDAQRSICFLCWSGFRVKNERHVSMPKPTVHSQTPERSMVGIVHVQLEECRLILYDLMTATTAYMNEHIVD